MGSAMSGVLNRIEHHQPVRPRDFHRGDGGIAPAGLTDDDASSVAQVAAGRDDEEAVVVVETIARMLGDMTGEPEKADKERRGDVNDDDDERGEGRERVTRLLKKEEEVGTAVVYYVVGGEPTTESAGPAGQEGKGVFRRGGEDVTVTRGLEATTVVYVVGDPTEAAVALGEKGRRDVRDE